MKADGYIVTDSCEDWEQGLSLYFGEFDTVPAHPEGVLTFRDDDEAVAVFPTRKDARRAITRTRKFQECFGLEPGRWEAIEPKACRIVPVKRVEIKEAPHAD